ncbi:sensor histidine kinase [Hyalangium rubrum]|uniref:histidine kinase n=1 Tax=Hyalangium rubrum TaxID=3103134 RepID=A0ABU5HAD4_9BACT|nr:PAS domain-containing sensor histidine kinase [Hyalangium sp. s54d21]MDY7230049.1 PAS domain-containing sensor histidine kinase [Hyalangium sp. s54d21]
MAQPALPRILAAAPPFAVPDEARPFLQALLNAPGWAVGFLDRELRVQWANDALSALMGQPLSTLLGRPLAEAWAVLAPALSPLCARALAGEAVTGETLSGALSGPSSTEGMRHLRLSLMPAMTGGLLAGVTLMVQDETEQVREAERAREAETRLSALVDLSCDGYLIHDGSVVLEASRGGASLLGCTPEELSGQPVTRFLSPESRAASLEALRHMLEVPYELTAVRRTGQRVPLQVLAREVNYRGQPARLMAMWDISGRKAAEEAAMRTEYLREQFLGLVGHDLHNPLSTLHHGVQSLQRDGNLVGEQARNLSYMASAARRMERTVREMLDFTQARLTGGLRVQPAPVNLEAVVDAVLAEQRMTQPDRTILVATEGDLKGQWDEMRLMQLLCNLLQNALYHSPKGASVALDVKGASDGVTLSVLHQGPALPPEDREAVFEPFRRGKRAGGGELGLGLYVARQIAEAHGGRISVESSAERGTSFKAWLPRRVTVTY